MTFNENHLAFMLALRNRTAKYSTFSATKQMIINQLQSKGMINMDDEMFVYNSELGDRVLDMTINMFNDTVHNP